MKRLLCLCLSIALAVILGISPSANANGGNIVELNGYTVVFDEETSFTPDEQVALAQYIVTDCTKNSSSQTYGLMCTLFGHKTTTESVIVVEHCVQAAQPRCVKHYEYLTTCSRCDYTEVEIVSSEYIYCCD